MARITLLSLCAAALSFSTAHADVLPDSTRLLDIAPGQSRIVAVKPYTFSFIDGVSINPAWTGECEGVRGAGEKSKFNQGVVVHPGDFLSIESVGIEGSDFHGHDVVFRVNVHTREQPELTRDSFKLVCYRVISALKLTDPDKVLILHLRRAFDWSFWVDGSLKP